LKIVQDWSFVSTSGLDFLGGLPPWAGDKDFDLTCVRAVLEALGNPQDQLKVVHVAGTNGKGSTAVFIASILAKGGRRVGLTVSPDMGRVAERVCIDGLPVALDELDCALLQVKAAALKQEAQISYFEAITIAAFLIFRDRMVDFAVVEVGLGGRKDATNVVSSPLATAIVSIGLDHQHLLGESLSEIAKEKAGIARARVPMVVGAVNSEAYEAIYREVKEVGAPMFCSGRDFSCIPGDVGFDFVSSTGTKLNLQPSLQGAHQGNNAAVAAELCLQLGVSSELIERGVSTVHWPARLERLQAGKRDLLLDCAHNPEGIASLLSYIGQLGLSRVDLCFGVLKTKNWPQMIEMLRPHVANWIVVEPDSTMKVSAEELGSYLSRSGISFTEYGQDWQRVVEEEIEQNISSSENLLVISGSIYMVSEFRARLCPESTPYWNNQ